MVDPGPLLTSPYAESYNQEYRLSELKDLPAKSTHLTGGKLKQGKGTCLQFWGQLATES